MAAKYSIHRIPRLGHSIAPLRHAVTPPSIPLHLSRLPSSQYSQYSNLSHSTRVSSISAVSKPARYTPHTPTITTCSIPRYSLARNFSSTPSSSRDHYFDTLKFVQRLQDEGFTHEQSVAMMKVLSDVIEESVTNLTRTLVPKEEQEKITYTQKVDFSKLRSDLQTYHSLEYTATRNEYERLSSEIAKLNSRLREEILRAQNSVKLDLNLEKGRIREEASVQELRIKETDTRIETEVGAIRGTLEAVKFSTLQWLIGVCTGTAALILGVWRLLA